MLWTGKERVKWFSWKKPVKTTGQFYGRLFDFFKKFEKLWLYSYIITGVLKFFWRPWLRRNLRTALITCEGSFLFLIAALPWKKNHILFIHIIWCWGQVPSIENLPLNLKKKNSFPRGGVHHLFLWIEVKYFYHHFLLRFEIDWHSYWHPFFFLFFCHNCVIMVYSLFFCAKFHRNEKKRQNKKRRERERKVSATYSIFLLWKFSSNFKL